MTRIAIVSVGLVTLFTALTASSSVLGLGGAVVQLGLDDLACDVGGVALSYTIDGSGNVAHATVSGIDGACFGKMLLFDTDASEGGPLIYVPIASTTHTFNFPTPVPISAINMATISIVGGD